MHSLRAQLEQCLQGRVCLVGVGNADFGDDGLGVKLAEALQQQRVGGLPDRTPQVLIAGATPERHLGRLTESGFDSVIFLDAVEFGGTPGSVVCLDSAEMTARLPQVSTHRISLGLLAQLIEANGRTKTWLLGVQPGSLQPGSGLSPAVQATLETLRELVGNCKKVASAC